ncbi:MAG: glycosyltransferase family 4 protein, partial [Desulfobacteraceae bacterium]|nr:glycosyltransferase family 4 protein [Desulfobacteraceae bacterium]
GTTRSMKIIRKSSERVICNSKAISNKMGQYIPAGKLTVVYNGLLEGSKTASEIPVRKAPHQEQSILCIAGAIASHKGQKDAIIALSLLRRRGVNARLRILGLGHWLYLRGLKRLANELGVSEHIMWYGYLTNALDVYRSSDVLLVCSRFEPFGRVAVEAMSVGTPVIGTNGGGLIEIIDDGYNGLLYPAGNYEMLADQIMRLLTELNLYEFISRNAILSVYERYTQDRYVNEIELIIKETIKEPARKNY